MALSARAEKLLMSAQPIFGIWSIESVIGEGASGTVYEIHSVDGGIGALKVIPVSVDEVDNSYSTIITSDKKQSAKYIDEMTEDIMSEIKIMHSLSGKRGIVGCLEYGMLETRDDGNVLRLILMRMEKLCSLNQVMRDDMSFSQNDIVKMGIDLCSALTECSSRNIIHRDIKPANIFITPNGEYQLGDFGTARLQERTMMASRKGTLAYIAPEIASGQSYNATVDIYSLGIVMYQLLNNRRLPFLDGDFKFSDMELAVEKRLSGQTLPLPEKASEELGEIICKMCAFLPKERYSSAEECKKALDEYSCSKGKFRRKSKAKSTVKLLTAFAAAAAAIAVAVISTPIIYSAITEKKMSEDESIRTTEDKSIRMSDDESIAAAAAETETLHQPCISSGNVNSSGMAACDGEWLYTSQDKLGERGYRVSLKDGKKEILCDYIMSDINLTDKYVVFSSQYTVDYTVRTSDSYSSLQGLFRMKKDGGGLTCLDEDYVINPVVYNEYIYYIVSSDEDNTLFRLPIEGGAREALGVYSKSTYNFYPQGDKLYIYDREKQQLIATGLDGSNGRVVLEESIDTFCIENGKLYFTFSSLLAGNEIYICDIEELADKEFNINDRAMVNMIKAPQKIFDFNVCNGIIYFTTYIYAAAQNGSDDNGVYRLSEDNINFDKIYEGNVLKIQVVDDKLYLSDGNAIFKMNPDGSNLQKQSDMSDFYNMT